MFLMRSNREEGGLGFEAFGLAVSAGVFDVLGDVVAEVAALAEVGQILGADVVFIVLVGTGCEGLNEVGGGEDNLGSGHRMRLVIDGLAPLAPALRTARNHPADARPVARIPLPVDRHDFKRFFL